MHVNCPFDEPLYPEDEGRVPGDGPVPPLPARLRPHQPCARRRAPSAASRLALFSRQERILLLGGDAADHPARRRLHAWHRVGVVAGDSTSGLGLDPHSVVAMDRWMRRWRRPASRGTT